MHFEAKDDWSVGDVLRRLRFERDLAEAMDSFADIKVSSRAVAEPFGRPH